MWQSGCSCGCMPKEARKHWALPHCIQACPAQLARVLLDKQQCSLPFRYRENRIDGRDGFGGWLLVHCSPAASGRPSCCSETQSLCCSCGRKLEEQLCTAPCCPPLGCAVTFRRGQANGQAGKGGEQGTSAATDASSGPAGWVFLASLSLAVAGNIIGKQSAWIAASSGRPDCVLCSSSGAPPAAVHETARTWRIACLCDGRRDTKKERGGRGPGPSRYQSQRHTLPACPPPACSAGRHRFNAEQLQCRHRSAGHRGTSQCCMRHAAWLAGWLCTRLCYVVSWCRCVFCPGLLASP